VTKRRSLGRNRDLRSEAESKLGERTVYVRPGKNQKKSADVGTEGRNKKTRRTCGEDAPEVSKVRSEERDTQRGENLRRIFLGRGYLGGVHSRPRVGVRIGHPSGISTVGMLLGASSLLSREIAAGGGVEVRAVTSQKKKTAR